MRSRGRLWPANWSGRAKDLLFAVLIAAISFFVYAYSPVVQSTDSRYILQVAQSLILEGNLDLDEYVEQGLIEPDDYRVVQIGAHVYSFFPLGTSLLAVAPVALYRAVGPVLGPGVGELYLVFEMLVASAFVAICAAVIYGIGRVSLTRLWSVFLAGIFAFGTSAWSTASRALWQHGPSMLMLSLALYIVLLAEKRPKWIVWAGLPLACAYVIRPTNSIPVVCLTIYILVRHRERILGFLALAAAVAIPFLILNLATYRALLPPYYLPSRLSTNNAFWEAMAANLVSPARGLFVYSPVFVAAVIGVLLKIRDRDLDKLDVALLVALLLHWVAISSFQHWWGGHSFGPRLFCDMVPYLVYFTAAAIARLSRHAGRARIAYAVCFAVLVEASIFTHGRGALAQATKAWNLEPVNVDKDPSRVWDWWDAQFLRGVTGLDALISPKIASRPGYVQIVRLPDDLYTHQARLELREMRDKRFRWQASAPSGVVLKPLQGDGAVRYELLVSVPWRDYPVGQHTWGEIEVWAWPDRRQNGREVVMSVPVVVHVIESTHVIYLPLISYSTVD